MLGLDDEAVELFGQDGPASRARGWAPRRDGRADARPRLEQLALDERRQRLLRRVRIDLEFLAQGADRREGSPACNCPVTIALVTAKTSWSWRERPGRIDTLNGSTVYYLH